MTNLGARPSVVFLILGTVSTDAKQPAHRAVHDERLFPATMKMGVSCVAEMSNITCVHRARHVTLPARFTSQVFHGTESLVIEIQPQKRIYSRAIGRLDIFHILFTTLG